MLTKSIAPIETILMRNNTNISKCWQTTQTLVSVGKQFDVLWHCVVLFLLNILFYYITDIFEF